MLQAQRMTKFMCSYNEQTKTCNSTKKMHPNEVTLSLNSFSIIVECQCHSVQHLSLPLSSARHHQSVCRLPCLALDRKREPVFLRVRQMDTNHHVLHNIIQTKHEIETHREHNFLSSQKKITGLRSHCLNESVGFSSRCMMTLT